MNWKPHNAGSSDLRQIEDILYQIFKQPRRVAYVLAVAIILVGALTSFYEVQPDEKAVVLRFGRYLSTEEPGPHFKIPFGVDQVFKVPTRIEQEAFGFRLNTGYTPQERARTTMIASPGEESVMLTGDLNVAEVQWVVQYQISDPRKVLFNVVSHQKNIRDISIAVMRRVVGNRSVFDVLTVGREQLAHEARRILQETLDGYDMGVRITDLNLQRVTPPEPVQPSFNDVSSAIQNKNEIITLANAEYDRLIPEAQGKAERELLSAEGYRSETINTALGDANRIKKVMLEYAKAPEATKIRIYLETQEKLLSRLKSVTVVDPALKGILPLFPGESLEPALRAASSELEEK